MRRQRFAWAFFVLSVILTAYGAYSVIYNVNQGKPVPALGIVFLVLGGIMLLLELILFLIGRFLKKNRPAPTEPVKAKEEPKPEIKEEPKEEPKVEEKGEPANEPEPNSGPAPRPTRTYSDEVTYERRAPRRPYHGGSGYVRQVGYGPVLRVEEEEILDMRTNTYYCIEGNLVKQRGSGPVFEIYGNRIRAAFGGYLYEISGDSVNKVYGGYYASMGGGYLQTYDLREKYEIPSSLSTGQKLAIVALVFGTY